MNNLSLSYWRMDRLILLAICLLSGYLLKKLQILRIEDSKILNQVLVYFFIPILTLLHIPSLKLKWIHLWLTLSPLLLFVGSILFFATLSQFYKWDKKITGALTLSSGIGSISFVGFPIFEMLYGSEGLALGIILSLAGTFLVCNTLGIITGLYYSEKAKTIKDFVNTIFKFPPFIALLIAIFLNLNSISFSTTFINILSELARPFSIIALISIGIQIEYKIDHHYKNYLALGHFYKLILAPIIIFTISLIFFDLDSTTTKICILGATVGSMNTISIIGQQLGLDYKLLSLMPALSIPLSIPIMIGLNYLLF